MRPRRLDPCFLAVSAKVFCPLSLFTLSSASERVEAFCFFFILQPRDADLLEQKIVFP